MAHLFLMVHPIVVHSRTWLPKVSWCGPWFFPVVIWFISTITRSVVCYFHNKRIRCYLGCSVTEPCTSRLHGILFCNCCRTHLHGNLSSGGPVSRMLCSSIVVCVALLDCWCSVRVEFLDLPFLLDLLWRFLMN